MTIDIYAVIGNPVSHSLSPIIQTMFAKQTQQNLKYIAIEAPLDKFFDTFTIFRSQGGKGCNVTVPFKQQAWDIVNKYSERAEQAKAVNTIVINSDNLFGDNTDGFGLMRDLTLNLNVSLKQAQILILGAGGAVRGMLGPLLAEQPSLVRIANRTAKKAVELATEFSPFGKIFGGGFDEVGQQQFNLIINATSAGLHYEELNLPASLIHPDVICYDISYQHKVTHFLKWAQKLGAKKCFNGVGMLVEQAAESFYLWRNVRPDTKPILEYLAKK